MGSWWAVGAGLVGVLVASVHGCAAETTPAPAAPTAEEVRVGTPGDHVTFFVIGKSWHHEQDAAGEVKLVDLGYFAEIFKAPGGEVSDARMQLRRPGSEPIPFVREADAGAVLHARAGERHRDLAALDAELPNGDYGFSFVTPGGTVEDFTVTLAGADGKTDLPPPPRITLRQGDAEVRPDAIAPGVDVLVSWTPFSTGRADPNGISDDLIFVMMADCHKNRAFHSGRPLGTPNPLEPGHDSERVLTFEATQITIPGATFVPGMRFVLDVEHARLLQTDRREGVVGMSTFAVTTHLDMQVTGEPGDRACPPAKAGE